MIAFQTARVVVLIDDLVTDVVAGTFQGDFQNH